VRPGQAAADRAGPAPAQQGSVPMTEDRRGILAASAALLAAAWLAGCAKPPQAAEDSPMPQASAAALAQSRAEAQPEGPKYPPLAKATKLRASDGGKRPVEWAVLAGDWSADARGRITGRADRNGYLCRVKPHADDLRVTATMRAVEGSEVTVWICGSPRRTELDGYALAVSADGAKLQRQGQDVKRIWDVLLRPRRDHVLTFERRGATLGGFLDGAARPFVEWTDPQPLRGKGHRALGFYVWSGRIAVSKIKVEALAALK